MISGVHVVSYGAECMTGYGDGHGHARWSRKDGFKTEAPLNGVVVSVRWRWHNRVTEKSNWFTENPQNTDDQRRDLLWQSIHSCATWATAKAGWWWRVWMPRLWMQPCSSRHLRGLQVHLRERELVLYSHRWVLLGGWITGAYGPAGERKGCYSAPKRERGARLLIGCSSNFFYVRQPIMQRRCKKRRGRGKRKGNGGRRVTEI